MMITPAARAELANRYGLHANQIREVPGGVANRAYLLGDDLFLRIPRTPEFERDLRKEVAVIPVARAAGVRTPAIVDYNTLQSANTLQNTPYMVLERVHATDLTEAPPPSAEYWQELGREISSLHQVEASPPGVPHDDGGGDPRPTVDKLATDGYLDPGTANWLLTWFDRLSKHIPPHQPHVLLHGDLAPQNLMTNQTIIDWGDAAWGPPGMEFAKLPLEQVAATLPSYRTTDGIEAAALWFHLSWGVSSIPRPPRPNERHWTAPPVSRLLGVLRFFASGQAPESWRRLA
jgi:aminoglycoside phosphotransferase (APT) family kinase protein